MLYAIQVHNYRDAVHYLFPVKKKPKTTLKAFERLQAAWNNEYPARMSDGIEYYSWEEINENTEDGFPINYRAISKDNTYEAHGKKYKIMGEVFTFSF